MGLFVQIELLLFGVLFDGLVLALEVRYGFMAFLHLRPQGFLQSVFIFHIAILFSGSI